MNALADLVASLPVWVRWGPTFFYPCLALGTLLPLTWLLEAWLLRPLRRLPEGAHWSERARLGFPARTRLVSWALTSTLLVGMAWILWLGRLTPIDVAIAPALATFVATMIAVARVARLVAPDRPRLTLRGLAGLLALSWGQMSMLFALALLARDDFGPMTWLALVLGLGLSLVWAFGLPAAAAAAIGLFEAPSAELATLVASSASRLDVKPPQISVADLPMANAFALVPGERLILTRAVLEGLDGAGTTTQGALLAERLRAALALCRREAGGSVRLELMPGEAEDVGVDRVDRACVTRAVRREMDRGRPDTAQTLRFEVDEELGVHTSSASARARR